MKRLRFPFLKCLVHLLDTHFRSLDYLRTTVAKLLRLCGKPVKSYWTNISSLSVKELVSVLARGYLYRAVGVASCTIACLVPFGFGVNRFFFAY